ncbi:hypothetical protein AA106_00010 [Photorhabdus laumondii subsp. laumondii]|nr:hypothetical protein AA106_00010 [Photorhabdus laumondii subsp. laumondii]
MDIRDEISKVLTSGLSVFQIHVNGNQVPLKNSTELSVHLYPMDFKMHRGGKGANPREHSKLCDRGERVQPTKRQLEG